MRPISTAFKYGVAFSRRMAEEHSARVASIEARLQSVRMEIDDDDEDEEQGEETLADIELERKRNIARNQEILRQLGLA